MSANQVELAVKLTADADDATRAARDVGDAFGRMASDVDDASRKCDSASSRLDSVGDSADEMASKSSQAAGGLGDLGGALSMMPGPLGAVGTGMEALAPAIMGVTGASDLLNLVTQSTVVTSAKAKAAAVAQAVSSRALAVATRTQAIAQRVLNAAMRANPIGLAVTAALLLVGAFVLLYKRSETFRRIVHAVMDAARKAIGKVWDILQAVGKFVGGVLLAYFRTYQRVVLAVWDAVRSAAGRAFDWIRDKVAAVVGVIRDKAQTVRDKFAAVWDGIKSKGRAAFDALTWPIQRIVDMVQNVLDKIGSIHLPSLSDLNPFAGRRTTTTTAGRVAVGGSYYDAPTVTSSGPSITNTINLYGVAASGDDVVRQLSTLFARYGMQLGQVIP